MKYSRLTKEQFEALGEEFALFLSSNSIDIKQWDKIKTNSAESVEHILDMFSDLVWDDILDKVKFIDWEFFEDKQDWGLDLCYFLISVIVLPAISSGKKKIDIDELNIFKLYWKKIFYKKNFTYLKDPISFMKKNIYHQNHFFYKISDIMKNQINKSIL